MTQVQDPEQTQTVAIMAGRVGFCLSCFGVAAFSHSVHSGANAGSYEGAIAHPEYTLNLQPPEEDTHDVEASLDALMKAEDVKRILSDTEFATAKQRLIDVEKQRIRDIVSEAFASRDLSS